MNIPIPVDLAKNFSSEFLKSQKFKYITPDYKSTVAQLYISYVMGFANCFLEYKTEVRARGIKKRLEKLGFSVYYLNMNGTLDKKVLEVEFDGADI